MTRRRLVPPPASVVLLAPLLLVGFFMRWPFMHGRVSPELQPDTIGYFALADRMGAGHLFATSGTTRGPGYPVFLLLSDLLNGAREANVALVQHVLGLLVAAAVMLWAWRAIDRPTAILSCAVLALSPIVFIVEDEALPDFLVGVLLLAFAVVLATGALRPDGERRLRWLVAAGVLVGCAALTKPIAQAALLAVPITLALARWRRRELLLGAGAMLAAYLVVIAPFVIHSWIRFGEPSLTAQSGATLFVREFEIGGQQLSSDTRDGQIINEAVASNTAAGVQMRTYQTGLIALERVRGINALEAARRERALALRAIAKQPFGYTWKTIQLSDRFLYEMLGSAPVAESLLPRAGANHTGFAHATWSWGGWLVNRWWMFSMHGAALLLALFIGTRRRRVACTALISTGACVAVATAALHGGLPRYSWSMAPLTYTAGFAGIVIGAKTLWRGWRGYRLV